MSTTLTPQAGIAAHPRITGPQPELQIQGGGPGLCTWRVFDAAAPVNVRTHHGYAAGQVHFSVAATQDEIDSAYATARAEAETALTEVRRILAR